MVASQLVDILVVIDLLRQRSDVLVNELESAIVPLAKLQGLQEGSVLPLEASAGAIQVRILASGRPFARGSLVSVGDGYGVLIEAE